MSACVATDRLLQTLQVHTPGATEAVLSLEIFNVMDEFFRRTMAWRHQDDIMLQKGVNEYTYGVPAGAVLVRVIGVAHNGLPVPMVGQAGSISSGTGLLDPAMVFPDGDAVYDPDLIGNTVEAPTIFSWATYRPDIINITVPNVELEQNPAVMIMALTLDKTCLEDENCGDWAVPEWIWTMFFQDILDGTLGRLYNMPSKPWASEKQGLIHSRKFRNHMAFRKQESGRGFVYGAPGPWKFPGTWSRR